MGEVRWGCEEPGIEDSHLVKGSGYYRKMHHISMHGDVCWWVVFLV